MPIPSVVAAVLFILIGFQIPAFAEEIKIGVLAVRGTEKTVKRWYPLVDYLQKRIPDYAFALVPLSLKKISAAGEGS